MKKDLWQSLPLFTRTCIALAAAIPPGALLLQVCGGAIAEQVQASWQQGDALLAMLVLVLAGEVAMIVGGENE
jgi:hypothetical protein